MRLKLKKTITAQEADALINKYYDGATTNTEEERLRRFLRQTGLPSKYRAEQAIFGYFEQQAAEEFVVVFDGEAVETVVIMLVGVGAVDGQAVGKGAVAVHAASFSGRQTRASR